MKCVLLFCTAIEAMQHIPTEDLSEEVFLQCFDLVKSNQKHMYKCSELPWTDGGKKREMKSEGMTYLLSFDDDHEVRAFCSYMIDYEDDFLVVYVYEVQVKPKYHRQGFGGQMMDLVEEAGRQNRVEKAMLTVFTHNPNARAFYKKRGYVVDPSSPEPRVLRGKKKEPTYLILSKAL
jgi:ribosomal protein S18 acetylase RimI-like enzyme